MLINSHFFSKGFMSRQPSLSDVLERHAQATLSKIKNISAQEQMTEPFLTGLIKKSLVQQLSLQTESMTVKRRLEQLDGSVFPGDFSVEPGRLYPKTVARISIPFSGEADVLQYTPDRDHSRYPFGRVSGNLIEFDIILWGNQNRCQFIFLLATALQLPTWDVNPAFLRTAWRITR